MLMNQYYEHYVGHHSNDSGCSCTIYKNGGNVVNFKQEDDLGGLLVIILAYYTGGYYVQDTCN